jgi:hypothetical protein
MDSGWFWQLISSKLLAPGVPRLHDTALWLSYFHWRSTPNQNDIQYTVYTGELQSPPLDLIKPSISWNLTWQWTCLTGGTVVQSTQSADHFVEEDNNVRPWQWHKLGKNYSIWCRGCWMAKVEKANSLGVHVHMVSNKRSRLKIKKSDTANIHWNFIFIPFQDISFVSPFKYRGK